MKNTIRTYQIGLGAIGIFTLMLVILLVNKAGSTRKDAETDKAAQQAVTKLNTYTSSRGTIPEDLSEVGVSNAPSTIKYTKLSESSFKFCVTYKSASSGFDASSAVTDVATGSLGNKYSSLNDTSTNYSDNSYLYLPSTHKKGENCQTITPYISNSGSSNNYYDSFGSSSNSSSSGATILGGLNSKSRDTERQTDLRVLQSQVEAYYAENGFYPTVTNLNDATWVAKNLVGMDKEALRDPQGSAYMLTATPTKTIYSYNATSTTNPGKTCDNVKIDCDAYVLTAKLESGSDFTLDSLN